MCQQYKATLVALPMATPYLVVRLSLMTVLLCRQHSTVCVPNNRLPCAGDLLVKKAREGVRVCMLVWDDKSSLNHGILQPWANHGGGSGMLMTHDEDTRRFFANTGVRCTSCCSCCCCWCYC